MFKRAYGTGKILRERNCLSIPTACVTCAPGTIRASRPDLGSSHKTPDVHQTHRSMDKLDDPDLTSITLTLHGFRFFKSLAEFVSGCFEFPERLIGIMGVESSKNEVENLVCYARGFNAGKQ